MFIKLEDLVNLLDYRKLNSLLIMAQKRKLRLLNKARNVVAVYKAENVYYSRQDLYLEEEALSFGVDPDALRAAYHEMFQQFYQEGKDPEPSQVELELLRVVATDHSQRERAAAENRIRQSLLNNFGFCPSTSKAIVTRWLESFSQ